MSSYLSINNINKEFTVNGNKVSVLENINLDIKEGEFVVIVGHSGCGKSTLLKIIAGLEFSDTGSVKLNDRVIKKPGIDRGMIFQEHRLFPWMTINKNLQIGLAKVPKNEKDMLIDKYLGLVNLKDFKYAYPKQLSGGMSQRAAIARALITKPQVLLLDEPFGALDALTKIELQQEILNIRHECKNTMIMVTHDIEEAVFVADRVVVMSSRPGKIKDIIKIELGHNRDRGSSDFAFYKKKIYKHFFEDKVEQPEYSI